MRRLSTSQAGASNVHGNVREIWHENVEARQDCGTVQTLRQSGESSTGLRGLNERQTSGERWLEGWKVGGLIGIVPSDRIQCSAVTWGECETGMAEDYLPISDMMLPTYVSQ